MEIARRLWHRLAGWEYTWLCLLVLVIVILHFITINRPPALILDEQYYVPEARSILQGHGMLRLEHPPLGKLFIVFGIYLFGDNPVGWRFFSILFGAISIVLFYLVCRRLEMTKRASFLATFLLALDNLSFVHASVAMLDVYSLTFMSLSFWLYLRGQYLASGVSVGLSALAKLSGVLALPAILLHWLLTKRGRPVQFVGCMLSSYLSFFLLMPLFDFITSREFLNPIKRLLDMLGSSSALTFATATHEAASRPWDWLLRPEIMPYWYDPHYLAAISFTIWALIIPVFGYMIYRAIKRDEAGLFGLSWFASTYLVWIPLSLITDRLSFVYYFYPSVGAVCIGLGLGLNQLLSIWETRRTGRLRWVAILSVAGYLLLHVSVFVILSPVFIRWPMLYSP